MDFRRASFVMPLERRPRFCARMRKSAVLTAFNALEFVVSLLRAPKSLPVYTPLDAGEVVSVKMHLQFGWCPTVPSDMTMSAPRNTRPLLRRQ